MNHQNVVRCYAVVCDDCESWSDPVEWETDCDVTLKEWTRADDRVRCAWCEDRRVNPDKYASMKSVVERLNAGDAS